MRKIAMCFLLLFAVSATTMGSAETTEKVVVVVDANYPPYTFGTAEQAEGLYTRLIGEIFSRCGIGVKILALPWEKALKAGEEGRAAVGGIYKTRARMEIYDYSEPIFEENLVVYVQKGKPFPFSQLSDLQGRTIGLNRAWSYGDEFDAARKEYHFTVQEADSNLENFKKLVEGRIDCLVADRVAASQIIRLENWRNQVEALGTPVAVNQAYLAFAKRLEKRQVLERFNRELAEMKKDGSYEKLVQDIISNVPILEIRVE